MNKYGPNVTKLITKFIAREAIPRGGGIADGLEFFRNPDHRKQVLEKAEADTLAAIKTIKTTPGHLYGIDDEVIAGILIQKIEEKNR
jgi:hypothetical protein